MDTMAKKCEQQERQIRIQSQSPGAHKMECLQKVVLSKIPLDTVLFLWICAINNDLVVH